MTELAQGYMSSEQFMAFLNGAATLPFDTWSWAVLPLVLVGGVALNLTPCVLPMIPVNLLVIGKSARNGLLYGLGMALAYGTLGVLAAVGGLAFGTIQGSPYFNLAFAVVFACMALALSGVFVLDFSHGRMKFHGGAFFMGVLAALLAGACVAPVLIAVLLLTARLFAAGHHLALGLPFVLGLGMGLPWPFVGAGLNVLPKPGAWMKTVNRLMALVLLGLAIWYGRLAVVGFRRAEPAVRTARQSVTPKTFSLEGVPRPVLVDCWATWCKNCAAMERVMARDDVRKALSRYTVIRLQAEDIDELRQLKGFEAVQGLPAFVIFK